MLQQLHCEFDENKNKQKRGRSFFLIFIFSTFRKQMLLMAGFEPGLSGVRSDRSANCATTAMEPVWPDWVIFGIYWEQILLPK